MMYDDQDLLFRTTINGQVSECYTRVEIGLTLPDGRVVWPPDEYKGFPVDTPAQRAILLEVLRKSAGDLSFPEEDFLAHYGWARRTLAISVKKESEEKLSIDSHVAFADYDVKPSGTNGGGADNDREKQRDETSNDTTVYERPVGGTA